MHIFDLPLEVFQEILYQMARVRGPTIARAMRLRLVSSVFSRELLRPLLVFRLLDEYPGFAVKGKTNKLTPFAVSYLEHRVMTERADGHRRVLLVQRVAEALSQEPLSGTKGRSMQEYVKELCSAILQHHSITEFQGFLEPTIWHEQPFDDSVLAGAICTRTMSIVQRWQDEGKRARPQEQIFGFWLRLVLRCPVDEILELAMPSTQTISFRKKRKHLFTLLARDGRTEEAFHVFNFKTQERPYTYCTWPRADVQGNTTPRELQLWLQKMCPEIWKFVLDIFKTQFPSHSIEQETFSIYLGQCAHKNWPELVPLMFDLAPDLKGTKGAIFEPMITACKNGHIDIVKILLTYKVDTIGAVAEASKWGHTEVVRTLLDYGAETTGALDQAIKNGYRDIAELLLDRGVNPVVVPQEALNSIIILEHEALFRLLVARGLRSTKGNLEGGKVFAREKGLESMVGLLDEATVDMES